jgi:hypothetical protein
MICIFSTNYVLRIQAGNCFDYKVAHFYGGNALAVLSVLIGMDNEL